VIPGCDGRVPGSGRQDTAVLSTIWRTTVQHTDDELTRRTYTVSEAATVLGIPRAKAYECVRTGELPSIRLGRRLVVPVKAVDDLLSGGR
jgi:excisionase family DNA binding protein